MSKKLLPEQRENLIKDIENNLYKIKDLSHALAAVSYCLLVENSNKFKTFEKEPEKDSTLEMDFDFKRYGVTESLLEIINDYATKVGNSLFKIEESHIAFETEK